jgi:hypothetical protein
VATRALEQLLTLPDEAPTPNPNVVATKLADGQAVLLDIDTGNYINLNQTAALIWNGIEVGDSPAAIQAQMVQKFHVAEEHAADSLARFIHQLGEAGLVQPPSEQPE